LIFSEVFVCRRLAPPLMGDPPLGRLLGGHWNG
jgi:hypothetical protein